MALPDKIYLAAVEPQLNGYAGIAWTDAEDMTEPIEYIRKDALLEWLIEGVETSERCHSEYGDTCAQVYQSVIDKLNEM